MSFLTEVISERFLYALGWSLLHSIWQGILVAVFTAVLLVFLHRQASRVRYLMSATSLLLILGLAVFTFAKLYMQYPENPVAVEAIFSEGPISADLAQLNIQESLQEKQTGSLAVWNVFYTKYAGYFQKHLPMIVILWALGITVLFLRFLGGLAYSRRLKHYKVRNLSQDWQDKVIVLASDLGVRRAVKLMESAIVKVPVVIGYFKPVILLPVGLITSIPTEQLEAIIIHELAHVYRRDYLVNILQSLIDILFFYHPAVWWLSAIIRQERENCCDDIVLEYTHNTSTYAQALTNIEAVQQAPELVMALGKNRASLLNRVRRILDNPQIRLDFTDGLVVACFFFICFAALIFQAKAELPSKEQYDNLQRNQSGKLSEVEESASDPSKKGTPVRLEFMGSSRKSVSYQEQGERKAIEQQIPQDTPDSQDIDLDIENEVDYDFENEETVENDGKKSHSHSYEHRIVPGPDTNQYAYSFSSSEPQSNSFYVPNDEWEQIIPVDSLKKWKRSNGKFRAYRFSPTEDGKSRVLIINGNTLKVIVDGEETVRWNPEDFEKLGVIIDSLDSEVKFATFPDLKVLPGFGEIPQLIDVKRKLEDFNGMNGEVWQVVSVIDEYDSARIASAKKLALARLEHERAKLQYEKEMHEHKLEQSQKALERLEKRLHGAKGHEHDMEEAHLKMGKANELREAIVEQLVKDDLVKKGEHFTFIISKKELFINGNKQPRSVHKEYLKLMDEIQEGLLTKEQQFIFSE